jgi:hypothetical protein
VTHGGEGGDVVAHGGVVEAVRASSKRIDPIEGECGAQRWSSTAEGETHRELEKIQKRLEL